jgi:tetraacyldisaccharide 4'-kinase
VSLTDRLIADWYAPRASLLVMALAPASLAFAALVRLRRMLYRRGILRSARLRVPVIVVGNISVGGSGKTPLVAEIAGALSQRGFHPGIVSRGYGRTVVSDAPLAVAPDDDPRRVGDEPLLLARGGYPVVVARDRIAAARALLANNPRCDVIIADDGLQHYRLARDIEIAVVDATRPLVRNWPLPAGPLREPPSRLADVDAVVTLVTDSGAPPRRGSFAMTLEGARFARVDDPLTTVPPSAFKGEVVHALAGIGNPARFFAQLAAMGIDAVTHPLPDHHRYTGAELAIADATAIVMTEKDAVKCEPFADARCWYLPVRARIDDALVTLIEGRLRGPQAA